MSEDEAWSKRMDAMNQMLGTEVLEAMRPWFATIEGWVTQAKEYGYTDEQARWLVLYSMGWRPSSTGGEST